MAKTWSIALLVALAAGVAGALWLGACHAHGGVTSGGGTSESEMLAGKDYSLGYCKVKEDAPAPCVGVRGKTASGVAPGCQHDNCTTAKANARTNLLTNIPSACGAYIDCGTPCRCIQKSAAGETVNVTRGPSIVACDADGTRRASKLDILETSNPVSANAD